MNIQLKINKHARTLKISPAGARTEFSLDGKGISADVVKVEPGVFSVLLGGEVFEACVSATPTGTLIFINGHEYFAEVDDPRQWRRGAGLATGVEGKQTVAAPMPGKIVKVLVKKGQRVEAGQGLLIVEAMKMQNEIKSPKEGAVERIAVAEGQPVNAGEILAVIA